jgi:TetR/AcrR family transcriptional repressor of nem operon
MPFGRSFVVSRMDCTIQSCIALLDCQIQNDCYRSGVDSNADTSTPRLTRKGEQTRERIVSAAAQLIFERGVAGTSVEEVKVAAGVSSSQLYHYFADKQALVHAVIAHQSAAVIAAQEPLLGKLDSLDALRAWRDQAVAVERGLQFRGGCPIGTLAGELAEADPEAREDIARGFARWEEAIAQGIEAMHQRGELPADVDPDRLALALLAAHQGGLILTQVRRDPAPLEAALDAMVDHVAELLAQTGAPVGKID